MTGQVPVLRGVQVPGRADAWRAAGFVVTDGHILLDEIVIGLGEPGWWLDPPVDADVDGLAPAPGGRAAYRAAHGTEHPRAEHPNAVTGLDHLVVATPDVERTTTALGRVGLTPRRTIDGLRGQPLRARFFVLGPAVLELVGPADAPAGDEAAGKPARIAGLAFVAPALDAFAEVATGPPRDAVQPGRKIVTLRGEGLGVPVAVLTPRVRRAERGPSR